MKKGYIKIILFLTVMLLVLFKSQSWLINSTNEILFWILFLAILIYIVGFEKDKTLYKKDTLIETFIFCFIYILLEYLLGLFLGFITNPYNLDFISIIKNITPILFLIIIEELFRYIIVTKGKNNFIVLCLSVVVFLVFNSVVTIGLYNIETNEGIFDFLILSFFPSLVTNVTLTYLALVGGYKPTILYRIILELIIYVAPIYADLGDYLDSIFKIVFPLLFLLRLCHLFKKKSNETSKQKSGKIITIILFLILCLLVSLISGYFKYYALVIASGSMSPNIDIGDVVIVEKIDEDHLEQIAEGDILVYKYDNKIIVHRVVKLTKIANELVFQTKGDNNDDIDNWLVYENQVIGIVKLKIRYIGYPTVLLNEYLSR